MSDLVSTTMGPEAIVKVSFSGGSLNVSLSYAGTQAGAQVSASVSIPALIEALKEKITNPTELSLLDGLEAILKVIP